MATQQLIIDVVTKNTQRLDKIERALNRTNRNLQQTGKFASTAGKLLAGAFAVNQLLKFANTVKNITSDFQTYHNQLRLITKDEKDRNRVFDNLVKMAKENRTAFGDTVDLYTKLRVSTEQLGVSEERVANVTSKLSKALQLAGADGNTASSVIRQFGQAMASGEVRGDEFRSLVEGLGPALTIMARETGINVGQLRKMSQAGELSAMVMFEMFEKSMAIDKEFNKMNSTLEQTEIAFGDAFSRAINKVAEATGLTSKYQTTLENLTKVLDKIAMGRPFKDLTLAELEAQAEAGKLEAVLAELQLRYGEDFLSMGIKDFIPGLIMMITEGKNIVKVRKEEVAGIIKLIEKYEKEHEAIKEKTKLQKEYEESMNDSHIEAYLKNEQKLAAERRKSAGEQDKAIKVLREKNQGFMTEMLLLNEHHSQEVERIRKERLEKIKELLDKEVIREEEAIAMKTEVNKAYHKEIQKMEDERLKRSQERHRQNIELIRQGKIQEIDLENATADQKKEITREAGRSILEQMATMNEKAFAAFKAVRIAEAIIEGKKAIQGAFAYGMGVGGPIAAFLFAGAAAAYTAAQVNAIRSTSFQGREMGGPVQKGKPYIVGEAGQEAFIPNQNGTIVPNHELGGKNEITINFNVDATDAASFDSMLVERRDTIVAVINEALNENGRRALV